MVGVKELLGGVKRRDVVEVRGQWLVENLQATHGHPHVSRERLVHGGVVQGQEYRHIWLQGGEEWARVILRETLRPYSLWKYDKMYIKLQRHGDFVCDHKLDVWKYSSWPTNLYEGGYLSFMAMIHRA